MEFAPVLSGVAPVTFAVVVALVVRGVDAAARDAGVDVSASRNLRILSSISAETAGFCFKNIRAFSLP